MSGPGELVVGDLVGLFYEEGNKWGWLGCPSTRCARFSCPGHPNMATGFSSPEKWLTCDGEVFILYARGRKLGDAVQEHDNIVLFQRSAQKWLELGDYYLTHSDCLGVLRPPLPDKYELCWRTVLEVWKL